MSFGLPKTIEITGPGGIRLVLDADEIFPDDPGQGTPAMVYLGDYSGTYWCCYDTGELDCGAAGLDDNQVAWLDSVSNLVDKFMNRHLHRLKTGEELPLLAKED